MADYSIGCPSPQCDINSTSGEGPWFLSHILFKSLVTQWQ